MTSFRPGFFHAGSFSGPGGTRRATVFPCLCISTSSPFSTRSRYDDALFLNSVNDTFLMSILYITAQVCTNLCCLQRNNHKKRKKHKKGQGVLFPFCASCAACG